MGNYYFQCVLLYSTVDNEHALCFIVKRKPILVPFKIGKMFTEENIGKRHTQIREARLGAEHNYCARKQHVACETVDVLL